MRDKHLLGIVLTLLSSLGLVLGLDGCLLTQKPAEPLVRAFATKDLDCPNTDIRVIDEFGGRYKAIGCGRKAYYRTACDGLQCVVHGEGEAFVPWRDRPDPNDRTAR